MVSTPDLARNLEAAGRLVATAAAQGAELVGLPEYFCVLGRQDTDKLAVAESPGHGPIQSFLSTAAKRHGVWIVGGTMPMAVPGSAQRVRNTCLVYGPDGAAQARYDKIHLFGFQRGA